jgi:hypothetical protein
VRAHQRIALELARLHDVCGAIPAVPRAGRKPGKDEVLLWPTDARNAAALRALPAPRLALVSGAAINADMLARANVDCGFPLTNLPNHREILSAIMTSGAQEVALFHAGAEALAADLRARGFEAYTLGPPRQMTLVA